MSMRSRESVLVIGPSPDGEGGISGVLRWMIEQPPSAWEEFKLDHVASHPGRRQRTVGGALSSLLATARCIHRIRVLRPDIVHLLVGPRGSLRRKSLLAWWARRSGARVVVHLHSGSVEQTLMASESPEATTPAIRRLLSRADVVATLWTGPWRGMRTHGPGALWTVIGNPLPEVVAHSAGARDYDVAFVGRIATEKGAGLLTDLCRELTERGLRVAVAGSPEGTEGRACAAALGQMAGVELLGWLSRDRTQDVLRRSKLLIMPSKFEALPLGALEAMQQGCVVVGTPVGAVPTLLAENRGVVVPLDADVGTWADTVTALVGEETALGRMGRDAQEYVRTRYQPGAIRERYVATWRETRRTVSSTSCAQGRFDLLGACVDGVSLSAGVERAMSAAKSGAGGHVASCNASILVAAGSTPVLRAAFTESLLNLPDGSSVVWAARVLGHSLSQRVAGIDFAEAMLKACEEQQVGVFLLGSTLDTLNAVRDRCTDRYPALSVVGYQDGYYLDPEAVAREVATSGAGVTLIAMGSPLADGFATQFRALTGPTVTVTVGGTFDVWAGKLVRAPESWQRAGLEWLYRLLQEPRRLLWRYVSTNTVFVLRVWMRRLRGPRVR